MSVVGGDLRGAEVGGFFELVEGGLFFGGFRAFVRVTWESRVVDCSGLRVSSGFSVKAAQVNSGLACYDSGTGEGEDG